MLSHGMAITIESWNWIDFVSVDKNQMTATEGVAEHRW